MIKQYKKQLLIDFVEGKCEQCGKFFEKLDIHRIHRRGSYEDFRNLKILCKSCHLKFHQLEFKNVGSKY